jgi:serine/threonine-protein kinase
MLLEGRYRLLSRLGEGGMGVVYLAEHAGLGKRVAVKVLRGELSKDATFSRRFELEAIAASQIGHENIVDVTDLGRTPSGEMFYVMELLEGRSLGAVLRRERFLPLARAVSILVQVCRALEAAHARGIVHRDVKPQNVMLLAREGRPDFVKVVDFGISKVSTVQGDRLTEAGAILGTASYMAPEQARGTEVDSRADVYAVGVLTYELCTGTLPFRGENTFATMIQHMEAKAEPPSTRYPELGLPPELDALVMQALAKDPAARPSMARFRAGLEALPLGARSTLPVQEAPAAAVPHSVAPAVSAPVALQLPGRALDDASQAPSQASAGVVSRGKRTWALVGGACAVLVVMAAVLFSRGPATVTQAPAVAPEPVQASAPPPEPAPPPVPRARVTITSSPSGATVSVGGRVLGTTPLELDSPKEGDGPWTLSLAGHAPSSLASLPASGTVEVPLKKLPAASAPRPSASELKKVQELKPNPF